MKKTKSCLVEDRHNTMSCSHCFMCNKKIGLTYQEKNKLGAERVPAEQKQTLLTALHDGKSIGEARELSKIDDIGIACEIITQNIGQIHFLNREAV